MERLRGCVMGMLLFWFAGAAPAAVADGPARLDGGRTAARAPLSHILVAQTDATREFNIPAQALEDAVASFGLQAGRQISMDSQLGAGLSSQPVQGTYAPEEALNRLLQGTGLSYRTDGTTMVLEKAPPLPDLPPARSQETVPPSPSTAEAAKPQQKPVKVPEILVKDVREKDDDTKSYVAEEATTATRTDTPIIQVPQSVEVVTRKVMDDQKAIRLDQALRNVSGMFQGNTLGNRVDNFVCRGFPCAVFKNNLRNETEFQARTFRESANLQRIEVLKGPASVLYGRNQPGGVVNLLTKQPLADSHYSVESIFGSYGLFRPTIDLTGPLNEDKTVLYRLNVAYEKAESFRDFVDSERYFIAPVFTWKLSNRTSFTIEGEYLNDSRTFDSGIVAVGQGPASIPISRFLGDTFSNIKVRESRVGYVLQHQLNAQWTIESRFRADMINFQALGLQNGALQADNRTLNRTLFFSGLNQTSFYMRNDLIGKFKAASFDHSLLTGVEIGREYVSNPFGFRAFSTIDIYNPVYNQALGALPRQNPRQNFANSIGGYIEDQITLLENLKVLAGARYDLFYQHSNVNGTETKAENQGFSPRVGITYQPIKPISVYANFTRSFIPTFALLGAANNVFRPETGTQYEAGIKAEIVPGRLTSTLAFYRLVKRNVLTVDPNNPLFQVQTGEQRSHGIELDVAANLLPGWNVIATYAYTDARITNDNTFAEMNRLQNVARNSGSLWTTYDIQTGTLQGVGGGVGLYAVGERAGDLANSFELPGYVRMDAALYYRIPNIFTRTNMVAQLNIQNLLNQQYYAQAQTRTIIDPGAPFTVIGSLKFEFN